jgi:hypothetical protein
MENQHRQIKGYRELTQSDIDFINQVKQKSIEVGLLVDCIFQDASTDKRWADIAKTDLQTGFMALIRSISQPETF